MPKIDKFTVSTANGNGKSRHKLGLITADELTMGGYNNITTFSNRNTYLALDSYDSYWSISPASVRTGFTSFVLDAFEGVFQRTTVTATIGVRPMISIKYGIKVGGGGTTNDPYVIE